MAHITKQNWSFQGDDDAGASPPKWPRRAQVTAAECLMPWCECASRDTQTDDNTDVG